MFTCTCPRHVWLYTGCKCGAIASERKAKELASSAGKAFVPEESIYAGLRVRVSKKINTVPDYANLTYDEWVLYNGESGTVGAVFQDPTLVPDEYALVNFDALPTIPIPVDCLTLP